jgi:hypothetical protein
LFLCGRSILLENLKRRGFGHLFSGFLQQNGIPSKLKSLKVIIRSAGMIMKQLDEYWDTVIIQEEVASGFDEMAR